MIRNLVPGFLFAILLVVLIGAMQAHDRAVEIAARIEAIKAKPLPNPCHERDYLGRKLVATYYAYSDRSQTLRCTYTRRIYS